eukprot:CAMPEP_0114540794 /NCGR_PEP_ID=MMETSP0114-20121206/963_1 /TAXON_ID=31324 /ORGANISM="Goniomonas sp, Strain m" /LENGTH=120 /DNA_ID=CAMNT_0001724991 /DNA_START=141 /DNA_END=501 /DNA_ORIENTATION=-
MGSPQAFAAAVPPPVLAPVGAKPRVTSAKRREFTVVAHCLLVDADPGLGTRLWLVYDRVLLEGNRFRLFGHNGGLLLGHGIRVGDGSMAYRLAYRLRSGVAEAAQTSADPTAAKPPESPP